MISRHWLRNILSSKVQSNAFAIRTLSSTTKPSDDLEALLAKPSWSVKSLFTPPNSASTPTPQITQKQLHHLLRLSALPLPTSIAEESRMISDLQSQLQFVKAIQEVDTEGVEPLVALRDETEEGERERTIGLEAMRGELEKEEVVGMRGRIVRKKAAEAKGESGKEGGEGLDLLAQAPQRLGRYVVVDTAKD
ncbi:hypothetical protein HO173_001389 [Letharia columbiana]|uniref:Glutamyl-tRNA amidotransferase complex subunit Gta3 domain-containing protein n=1 Tax=Letharia columbiana TaxID=112416 RepID=A0A8H6G565_9LECA|nr:uncharacterized protein HO173_001389 [Letharia columbiana]KAF6240717.1 hypothetical protein HO173_001389 [Letharia columbiana]